MSDKILLVTAPDDSPVDAIRLLLVGLTPEHTQMISDTFTELASIPNFVLYIWQPGDDTDWLLDKKHKSHAIIFNADCQSDTIIGYMAAQSNSHYFGVLKTLKNVNNNAIYNTDDCSSIVNNLIIRYE
jgi:hypothetical protein